MTGLHVRQATVRYGKVTAVSEVNVDVPRGRIVALLGPSGCGKSTLLRAIAGLEDLAVGGITFDDNDVTNTPTHRRGFALMFQDGQLFEQRTVTDNVGYGLRLRGMSAAQRAVRVMELLELVGLAGLGPRYPNTLSGGQRQRVALARALAVSPRLLLLDEPLSSLDRAHREDLAPALREILVAAGTSTLLVTHDHEEAFAIADDLVLMREGCIVQAGPIADVWRNPADAWAARFLGYPTVLNGDAAEAIHTALPQAIDASSTWTEVALRRSALHLDPQGSLWGDVVSVRSATDLQRLLVNVPGIGEIPAVASLADLVEPGDSVRLRVLRDRLAPIQKSHV